MAYRQQRFAYAGLRVFDLACEAVSPLRLRASAVEIILWLATFIIWPSTVNY